MLVECIIKGFQDGKSIFRGGPNSCFFLTSSLPNQNKGDLNPSSSSSSNENIEGFNKKGHQNWIEAWYQMQIGLHSGSDSESSSSLIFGDRASFKRTTMEEQQAFFVYYSGHQEIHFNRRRPSFEILNSKSSLVLIQLTQDFLFFCARPVIWKWVLTQGSNPLEFAPLIWLTSLASFLFMSS